MPIMPTIPTIPTMPTIPSEEDKGKSASKSLDEESDDPNESKTVQTKEEDHQKNMSSTANNRSRYFDGNEESAETPGTSLEGTMEVEQWLIKQHIMAERQSPARTVSPYIWNNKTKSITRSTRTLSDHLTRSTTANVKCINPNQCDDGDSTSISYKTEGAGNVFNAQVEHVDIPFANNDGGDFFKVSAIVTLDNHPIEVYAKRVHDPKSRKLLIRIIIVVAIVIGTVIFIVLHFINKGHGNNGNGKGNPLGNQSDFNQSASSVTYSTEGPFNTTIGDIYGSNGGTSVSGVAYLFETGRIYLDLLKRNDTKFTVIAFSIELLPVEADESLISRYADTRWNGHIMSVLLNRVIEGEALTYADITDGLVRTTMAGYPVVFRKYPTFTANGEEIKWADIIYSNCVEHETGHVPVPLVPWMDKSNYDILLELNEERNGDISAFVALVNASDLKQMIMLKNTLTPMTLFVPTNDALSTITSVSNSSVSSDSLLMSHLIDGNLAKGAWQKTEIGEIINTNEVLITNKAGNLLVANIEEGEMTINGVVNVIQSDVFSYYGILHVIDSPLETLKALN